MTNFQSGTSRCRRATAGVHTIALCVAAFVLLSLVVPEMSEAQQQSEKLPRIGVLTFTQVTAGFQEPLRQGLRDHGYVEGQNILVEWRAAEGRPDRARALALELVQLKVDVIVANLTPAVQAAKEATSTIRIVMAAAGDPVGTGFVASLARPGGNITGMTGISAELAGKRIELLRELVPGLKQVGLLVNASNPFAKSLVGETRDAARRSGIQLHVVDVRRPREPTSVRSWPVGAIRSRQLSTQSGRLAQVQTPFFASAIPAPRRRSMADDVMGV